MNNYRWTVRVGLGGVGFLVILAAVADPYLQPVGRSLGAMMTAPFWCGVAGVGTSR